MPDVIQTANRFRAALDKQDVQALGRVVNAYTSLVGRLQGDIDALALEIASMEEPTAGKMMKLARYRRLLADAEAELSKFQSYMGVEVGSLGNAMVRRGIVESRELIVSAYGGDRRILGMMRDLPPEAVEQLLGFLDPSGPLYKRLSMLAPSTVDRLAQFIIDSVAMGKNPRTWARMIATQGLGMGLTDALRMARTVQLWSYREATRANYVANSHVVKGWVWYAELDDRTCPSCIAMHGTVHELDEPLNDHHNGRCLVPGTLVSSSSIMAFVSRRYDGEIISIRTSSNKFLTVTPNHPILTDHGWMPAYLIQKGDNVISYSGGEGASLAVDPNKNHMPSLIENIPTALNMDWLTLVPTSPKDFHGDGKGSDVHVISTNSLLLNYIESVSSEPVRKQILGCGRLEGYFLSPLGAFDALLKGSRAALYGVLRDPNSPELFISRSVLNHDLVGKRVTSKINPFDIQALANDAPRNTARTSERVDAFAPDIASDKFISRDRYFELFDCGGRSLNASEFIAGDFVTKQSAPLEFINEALLTNAKTTSANFSTYAGNISLDRVLEINVTTFSGHVYNLQTQEGIYNANSIITHNCAMIPITITNRNPVEETGPQWLEKQSEATQRQSLGKGRFDAWKEGKFEFSQLSTERLDDVYGMMRTATSLKDLLGEEE